MKIANKKLISKLFVRHSSGDKRRNDGKKNSIDFVIKLNEDDYMFERNVTIRDQCKSSSCKQTISLQDRVCQILPKFIRTGRIPNFRNISTRSGKSSTPVMFSKSAIGQHFLNSFICVKNYKKFAYFFIWSFAFSFICFRSRLHQIMQAKFMSPKRVCLQLETLAFITCCDASLKHPIIFVQLYYKIN